MGTEKELKFTKFGQAIFSSFSEKVLLKATQILWNIPEPDIPKNPANYILALCLKICKEEKIRPDWSMLDHYTGQTDFITDDGEVLFLKCDQPPELKAPCNLDNERICSSGLQHSIKYMDQKSITFLKEAGIIGKR